ncbi:hypothetical protein Noda2021_09400 [Candidatus Dependentiae bacterium Noda2021]|nr:hypothetical protein Noda2021_09400 [Candidatus Dependentiae bacterium Noda2021]
MNYTRYAKTLVAAILLVPVLLVNAKPAQPITKSTPQPIAQKKQVDTIKVMIFGPESTDIITQSDIDRPGLDGQKRKLDDIIIERLMYQDAEKYHMLPDDEAIEKQLRAVMTENKLTPQQMDGIFVSSGYTPEEGKRQFGIMIAVNSIINFKITSRLIVPDKEVNAYYQAHPEIIEAEYQLERTVIPFSAIQDKKAQQKRIEAQAKSGKLPDAVWSPAFWITESELAEHLQFVIKLYPGQCGMPLEIEDGFEVYRLSDKRPEKARSLQERYREIVNLLRQPKLQEMMEQYKKELLENSTIVYLD